MRHRPFHRSRIILLATALILACGVRASAQDHSAPKAQLLPGHSYSVTVRKSWSGNDGFKEIIPQVSTQAISIETGAMAADGMPVTLIVFRAQQIDEKTGKMTPDTQEWKFTFTLGADGVVRNLQAVSDEGHVPDAFIKTMLMQQFEALLFQTDVPIELKTPRRVNILASGPAPDGVHAQVSYEIEHAEDPNAQAASVTSTTGSALFDSGAKFYTERTQTDTSKMYVAEDGVQAERTVQMVVRTTWSTVIRTK